MLGGARATTNSRWSKTQLAPIKRDRKRSRLMLRITCWNEAQRNSSQRSCHGYPIAVSVKIIVARSQAARADVCFLSASAGGFSQTSATGCQLRILPLQRSGWRALASSYTRWRAARMSCSCPPCRWQGVTNRMAL